MIPVIILNLARSAARRAQIAARLDGLSIEHRFFDAIDGHLLTAAERELLAPPSALLFDRPLTAGEIGCAATHLAAIRAIAAGNDDFACTLEDDAVLADAIVDFLTPATLAALPPFDVLRLVSDPARWRFPAWQVAQSHGRGVFVASRPGFGGQGQIFSRTGAQKIAARIAVVQAPFDFALFHDCHVEGLRLFEVRPGLIEPDRQWLDRAMEAASDIGARSGLGHRGAPLAARLRQKAWRWRRKFMAAKAFFGTWGLEGLGRILRWWPPGAYFR